MTKTSIAISISAVQVFTPRRRAIFPGKPWERTVRKSRHNGSWAPSLCVISSIRTASPRAEGGLRRSAYARATFLRPTFARSHDRPLHAAHGRRADHLDRGPNAGRGEAHPLGEQRARGGAAPSLPADREPRARDACGVERAARVRGAARRGARPPQPERLPALRLFTPLPNDRAVSQVRRASRGES